jgi:hypothetical protein
MSNDPRATKLRKSAEAGDPNAMAELATDWISNTDPEGRIWLERAAAAGIGKALSSLGWSHEKGLHGGSVDLAKAVDHYQRAIAAGVTTLGPLDLVAHAKKLASKVKRQAKPGHDPLVELFAGAKLEDHKGKILAACLPSIRWVATPLAKDTLALGASKLGGRPDLPPGTSWPKSSTGRALEHVATLDFQNAPVLDGVPKIDGRLVFFYDAKNVPFGDDAEGAWAIVHIASKTEVVRTAAPKGTKTLKPSKLEPVVDRTLPAVTAHAYASMGLPQKALDRYRDLLDVWPRVDKSIEYHRSFGHGNVTDESDAPEPLLLLQVDSYEHGAIHWGDAGRLFFWIEPADLRAGRFAKARFQLQG